ncbi:DUF309 domain-containing protein [Rhodococcus olei]|uniref:DUF309 domain-containing protein n=1 Tax=Rhodococcus olei TaxID=2161675 RepID=A0ABP8PGI3_9NOCA
MNPVRRERDPEGRPRNARPRDGLGRPLPRGAVGVPRAPEGVVRAPAVTIAEAQRLLDAGMPFHAHEVLEDAWKSSPRGERALWQALAQLAVGWTHLLRGNAVGARALLVRGRDGIRCYVPDPPYALDLAGLVAWTDDVLVGLDDRRPCEAVHPPRLRR